jgi:hypothetical protein
LVGSPGCDRCRHLFETVSHILCDSEALAVLRFRHLGNHCLKPGDSTDVFINQVLYFFKSVGLLNA